MTCEQCRDNLTDFMEGELAPDAEREMREHVASCPECARAIEQTRALVAAMHGLPEVEPPGELRGRLRAIPRQMQPSSSAWWRRSRTVVATVAAAAATVLIVGSGVFFYQQEGGQPALPMVAERAAPPADEAFAPEADDGAPAVEAAEADPPTVGTESREIGRGTSTDDVAVPAEERIAEAPVEVEEPAMGAPPVALRMERSAPTPAPDRTELAPSRPRVSTPSPPPADVGPVPEPAPSLRAPSTDTVADTGEAAPVASTRDNGSRMTRVPTAGAAGVGPRGPQGPTGPAARAMVAEAEESPSADTLAMPEPAYLDAGEGVARARVGEGTPFTVGVTPPHEKVTGTIVPATIRLETEADVALARVTVSGSEDLELVGLGEDGVVFEGRLTAGQQTVLSVRMMARRAGSQTMTMRVRSTDPIVDTQLDVRMGEFAEPVPPAERPVQFNFVGTPIREAVSEVTRQSGLGVIVDPGVGEATVTARADDPVPAAAALRAIAESAGLQVTKKDGASVVEKAEDAQ